MRPVTSTIACVLLVMGVTAVRAEPPAQQIVNGIGMRMILVPAGEFIMGSPATEKGRQPDERQHSVRLSNAFYMGATEVTQAQWNALMDRNPSQRKGDVLPVEGVTWKDAVAFCRKLSEREGRVYRLPTEAEWEYACRAGSGGPFAGTGNLDDMGWHAGNASGQTHPPGDKAPNAWGLQDMHGNVAEWCGDWYAADYPDEAVVDATGPGEGKYRVVRGGSWDLFSPACRSAARSSRPGSHPHGTIGFRVVVPNAD